MKTHLFKLECLTDLHVGNGEANYSIIDNEVQKDTVLTDVPIIHASGIKGALKEHFERLWEKEINKEEKIRKIFGGVKKEKDKDGKEKIITVDGKYKFLSALCIARPLRVSCGDRPYVLATGSDILASFSDLLKGLGLSAFYSYQELQLGDGFSSNVRGIKIENIESKFLELECLKKLIGQDFAIAKTLRDYDLPTRARNCLDGDGNLWYEEIVPHKSIFYFAVITLDDSCELKFEKNSPVQFGGNASIGNGYTTVTEVFSA